MKGEPPQKEHGERLLLDRQRRAGRRLLRLSQGKVGSVDAERNHRQLGEHQPGDAQAIFQGVHLGLHL